MFLHAPLLTDLVTAGGVIIILITLLTMVRLRLHLMLIPEVIFTTHQLLHVILAIPLVVGFLQSKRPRFTTHLPHPPDTITQSCLPEVVSMEEEEGQGKTRHLEPYGDMACQLDQWVGLSPEWE